MSKQKILIIGAGIAGLRAAQVLSQDSFLVTIVDKGRGVGGRMATRRFADTKADHGAQYFSVKSKAFQDFIDEAEKQQIVKPWKVTDKTHLRYICPDGMSTLPKFMAQGLEVKLAQKIVRISNNIAFAESGEQFDFDKLVITAPIPQVLQLFEESEIELNDDEKNILNAIQYDPCWAVIAKINTSSNDTITGGKILENSSVSWVVDNAEKGLTVSPTLTIHASPSYSQLSLEEKAENVAKELITSISDIVNPEQIETYQIHRWRYALASQRASEPFLQLKNYPIYIGGDAFGVGNVEGAFVSGDAIAKAIC
ncbi:NAD(P)/FAD-dependent oxidoreductase [Flectobacillus longus]|uniref:NAD(P)/FAD-dependent oxidoreductase n=1 Tax=Flectobacillus longus TaxID=2984207 RepID=UPI0024B850FA|nr:FAD-dependent oxidoreductase [Flectobacillus longus]MDI9878744.1 FAD-dependent oxidoreductase [Flectobacillus longus]